jgi:hypothetical protein
MTLEQLRKILLSYPDVHEAPSYGTPGFRVRKKLLARINPRENALVLKVADLDEQEALMLANPKVFFITSHYEGHPYVLAHMDEMRRVDIEDVFEAAWRAAASKKTVAAFDPG